MPDTNLSPQVSGRGWFGGLAAGLLLALTGCSNGDVITKRYEMPAGLQTITVNDNVDMVLVQGTEAYAEVRAGEKVIDDIVVQVKGNELTLSNSSSYNWTRSYDTPREVTLHLPHIRHIFQRGYGLVRTSGQFRQDTLFMHVVGAGNMDLDLQGNYLNADMFELGDMTLRGRIEEMTVDVGGNGRLYADGLQTQRCYFKSTRDSNGDAYVRAQEFFGCRSYGTGTTYYAGPPRGTDIQVSSRGKVVAR